MITVTINSVDRTSSVKFNSIKKTDTLNQQVDILEFIVRAYGSLTYVPSLNHEVVVDRDGTTIFGGVIVRILETVKASKLLEYQVICSDYSQYLKRELVTERYENMTTQAIIADIVTNYTSGFTTASVVVGPTIESISFNRLTVADSLQKLADAIGYVWYVDYDRDIHFFPKNTEVAPFNLTDSSSNYVYDSLSITEDLTQLRNSVLVQGGESVSSGPRTETLVADGDNDQYNLVNKFSEKPAVTVDAVAQTVGLEFIDSDASFDCMWNFNEKYLRFTSGNVPTAAQVIEATQTYLIPIVVRVPSPASIATFGIYEFAITDKSIVSQQEAIDRALAELTSYQNQLYDGSFVTREDGLRSGQVININSTQRGKNIDVLIQSVSVRMRDPSGDSMDYEVKFATLKNIGIIEYLQNQLRSKEIIVDDQDTLLNYLQFSDTGTLSDSLATPTTNSPPYVYGPSAGNVGRWNFATWG